MYAHEKSFYNTTGRVIEAINPYGFFQASFIAQDV
jgi:hypothetical protein